MQPHELARVEPESPSFRAGRCQAAQPPVTRTRRTARPRTGTTCSAARSGITRNRSIPTSVRCLVVHGFWTRIDARTLSLTFPMWTRVTPKLWPKPRRKQNLGGARTP